MIAVKICGITRAEDAVAAAELGAAAVGFVLWPGSPRAVDVQTLSGITRRLPPFVTTVGVFVSPSREDILRAVEGAGLHAAQVHGETCIDDLRGGWILIRAAHVSDFAGRLVPDAPEDLTVHIDAADPDRHGGIGRVVDWRAAAIVAARRRVVLAGGLTPDNVAEAIRTVRPYAVDVASGVERAPGVKDADRMRAFIEAVRHHDDS